MPPRIIPRRVITVDDTGIVVRQPTRTPTARRSTTGGATRQQSSTARGTSSGSLGTRGNSISMSEAVRAVQYPERNSSRTRANYLMAQQEQETLGAVQRAGGDDDFLYPGQRGRWEDDNQKHGNSPYQRNTSEQRGAYLPLPKREPGKQTSGSDLDPSVTTPIMQSEDPQCFCYSDTLISACRVGALPRCTSTVFFSGFNVDDQGRTDSEPIGPRPSRQAPLWDEYADVSIRYPGAPGRVSSETTGKRGQANAANYIDSENLRLIGYSGGADAVLIFADQYSGRGQITDVVLLGGTMTGRMSETNTLDNVINGTPEWQRIVTELLQTGTDVLVFDDDAYDDYDWSTYTPPSGVSGTFTYIGSDNVLGGQTSANGIEASTTLHYDNPFNGSPTATNTNPDLVDFVDDWIRNY